MHVDVRVTFSRRVATSKKKLTDQWRNKKNHNYKKNKSGKIYALSGGSEANDSDSDSSEDYRFVGSISTKQVNSIDDKWSATVNVGKHKLTLKLDTGAHCNVLSEKTAKTLGVITAKSATKRLIAYNNQSIKFHASTNNLNK